MEIKDLELNYIYTRDDDLIYKVVYINHNSNWAVGLRYSLDENVCEPFIISNNWLNTEFNKFLHKSNDPRYYTLFGSMKVNDIGLLKIE